MKSSKKDNAVSFTVIMASFKKLFLKYLWHSPAQIMLSLLGRDMKVMDKFFWLKSKQLFGKHLFVRTTTYSMHLLYQCCRARASGPPGAFMYSPNKL